MSEPTARKYRRAGKLDWSDGRRRAYGGHGADPFEAVWPEVEALLGQDAGLQAKTVLQELQRRHPGQFQSGQIRTLQRRFRQWRALHGEEQEVYFAQRHGLASRLSRISRTWASWV